MVLNKLVENKYQNVSTGACIILLFLAVGLYYMDLTFLWNGYPIKLLTNTKILGNALKLFLPFILFGILYLYRKSNSKDVLISKWSLEFLWILIGVVSFPEGMSFLHLGFSILLYNLFKESAKDDIASFNWIIFGLTFMDFFGFAAIKGLLDISALGISATQFSRLYIPIWIYFVLIFAQSHNGAPFFSYVFIFLFLLNLVMAFNGINMIRNKTDKLDSNAGKEWWKDFSAGWTYLMHDLWQQAFNTSYLYGGNQQDSEDPQGVYLNELNKEEHLFRPDDSIYLWAELEAKKLDGQFDVTVTCKTEIETDTGVLEVFGVVDEVGNKESTIINIFPDVQRSIPCIFESLPEGSYDATFTAEFDFSTDANIKVYMMDRDRLMNDLRLLRDKGRDPTKNMVLQDLYDITDVDPESISTTGPILLAIGTDKSPWDFGDTNNIRPLFGITIQNLWDKGGYVKKINKIYFKIPDDFSIFDPSKSCDVDIKSSTSEPGYKVYETSDIIDEKIKEQKTVNCRLDINNAGLDSLPVTTRYLRAHVDYSYVLEKEISFEVEGYGLGNEYAEVASRGTVCCSSKIKGDNSIPTYYWAESSSACSEQADENPEIIYSIASADKCDTKLCCSVPATSGSTQYHYVDDEDACNIYDKPGIDAHIIDREYNYLCDQG